MIKMFKILGKRGRITIPYEIRQKVGFAYNDLLSFEELPDGKSVVIKKYVTTAIQIMQRKMKSHALLII